MGIKLFSPKEYIFKSHCTKTQIINALAVNVMEPDKSVGFDRIIDEPKRMRRYFEGVVNDNNFTINYKTYRFLTPASGAIGSFIPQIGGNLIETLDGVEVKVSFKPIGSPLIGLIFFLPIMIIIPIIAKGNFVSVETFIAIVAISSLISSLVFYNYRIKKDVEQLRVIFKADH